MLSSLYNLDYACSSFLRNLSTFFPTVVAIIWICAKNLGDSTFYICYSVPCKSYRVYRPDRRAGTQMHHTRIRARTRGLEKRVQPIRVCQELMHNPVYNSSARHSVIV